MWWTRAIAAILRHDILRLMRDRFLLGTAVYVAAMALAIRWLVPWLSAELLASRGLDITPWVPLGVSYFTIVNASVLTGIVGGLLLLEMREERAIKAILVAEIPVWIPLATLGAVIFLTGAASTILLSVFVGTGLPGWDAIIASAVIGAPTGVIFALILATAASNRVEAFAVLKVTSLLGLLPVGGFFVPEPAQYLVGLIPPYWACKVWWMSAAGAAGWGWIAVPGLLLSVLWTAILFARFRWAVGR